VRFSGTKYEKGDNTNNGNHYKCGEKWRGRTPRPPLLVNLLKRWAAPARTNTHTSRPFTEYCHKLWTHNPTALRVTSPTYGSCTACIVGVAKGTSATTSASTVRASCRHHLRPSGCPRHREIPDCMQVGKNTHHEYVTKLEYRKIITLYQRWSLCRMAARHAVTTSRRARYWQVRTSSSESLSCILLLTWRTCVLLLIWHLTSSSEH